MGVPLDMKERHRTRKGEGIIGVRVHTHTHTHVCAVPREIGAARVRVLERESFWM